MLKLSVNNYSDNVCRCMSYVDICDCVYFVSFLEEIVTIHNNYKFAQNLLSSVSAQDEHCFIVFADWYWEIFRTELKNTSV